MNTISIRSGLLLGAAFAGVIGATPAMAQAADESGSGSGDIIVTARRVEERLQDVPISMTVLDTQQIANRNITVANDLATYTPSLSSNERYGPEKQSFSLRGFNQDQSTAPTVGVYFAEVVGVRAQGGTTSGNTVGAGAFMDLANVQVLKGPQGTLFGRNTTGGAILLTPKKPTDNLEGYVEGSVGNYDMKRAQAAINIPLADTFKVRLAVDRMKRDGYMNNLASPTAEALNDRNYFAARLSILADLTPDLENYTIFSYSKSDTNGYGARITSCNSVNAPGAGAVITPACRVQFARQTARGDSLYDTESSVTNPYLKLEQWQAINTTTWRASDSLTVKNIASYGEFREATHFNLYTSNFIVAGLPAGVTVPFKYIELDLANPGGHNSAQSTFTEELQLQGNIGEAFNFVVGGYLEFSRPLGNSAGRTGIFLNCSAPVDLSTCSNPLGIGQVSESRTQLSFDNHGIFAQATYKLTPELSLTGGIRYTFDKIAGQTTSTRLTLNPSAATNPAAFAARFQDPVSGVFAARQCTDSYRLGNGFIAGGDPSRCLTKLTNKSTAPTWVIDLDYKPTNDILVYAKWARGYRQGGLNFTNPGLESWDPEHMDTFEGGVKTSFRGAVSGYLNVAGFYNKLRDMQLFAGLGANSFYPGVAGGAAIINAGKAHSYGIEVDGSVSFFDNSLRFDLGYAYLRTKIDQIADQATLNALTYGSPFDTRPLALPAGGFSTPGFITPTARLGGEFTLSPKHKLTLTGTYTLPLPESVGNLSLGGTMIYTGKQLANGSVPANLGPVGGGVLPGRILVNLNVNWNKVGGSPVDAAFFVTNLTKKVYAVNTGGGWNSSGIGDMLIGEPRMWGVRLKYSFGQ